MTERNADSPKVICWSCGKTLNDEGQSCPECCEPGILAHPQPREIMPFCGIERVSILDEPLGQVCCRCGKYVLWKSSEDWIIGPCPHCGAKGYHGTM